MITDIQDDTEVDNVTMLVRSYLHRAMKFTDSEAWTELSLTRLNKSNKGYGIVGNTIECGWRSTSSCHSSSSSSSRRTR